MASGANYSLCEARIFFSLSGMEGGFIQPPQTSSPNGPDMHPSTNKATPNYATNRLYYQCHYLLCGY